MKDGLILTKDREREELDAAIRNFGGKITQPGSYAESVPKKSTHEKKTRAEIDVAQKRRFSVLAWRVKAPSARLIKRLEEIVAQGKEHRIK